MYSIFVCEYKINRFNQEIRKIKDDISVVSTMSCFVGHPVGHNQLSV